MPSYRWPILVTGVRSIPTEHGTSHSIDFASVTNSAFDSFTEKVLEIYNDYNRAKEKAMNGFDACVNKGLNWEKSGSDLISLYKKILKI